MSNAVDKILFGKSSKLDDELYKARNPKTPITELQKLDYTNKYIKEALIQNRSTPSSILEKIDYSNVYKDSIGFLVFNRPLTSSILKAMLQHPDKMIKVRLCVNKKTNLEDIIQTVEEFPQLEEYPYRNTFFRSLYNLQPEKFAKYVQIRFDIDISDMPKTLVKEMFSI
jgi:hypothetical protein